MLKTCGRDYNYDERGYVPPEHACGKTFDDFDHMTICPHPHLDAPDWRKQIDDYMVSKGFVWSNERPGYIRAQQEQQA